jgi:hypothetical protein
MTPDMVTLRTRRQIERIVRRAEEARSRTAAAKPHNGRQTSRPPWSMQEERQFDLFEDGAD